MEKEFKYGQTVKIKNGGLHRLKHGSFGVYLREASSKKFGSNVHYIAGVTTHNPDLVTINVLHRENFEKVNDRPQ